MTGKEAYEKSQELKKELLLSLNNFEKSNNISFLKKAIEKIQEECPHLDNELNWTMADRCPYCGKWMG